MDLQELLLEKYNKYLDIKRVNYLNNCCEVLYEDNGNYHTIRIDENGDIKDIDKISVWVFEVGPGELITNTTNNFRNTDKIKNSVFISKRSINSLNKIIQQNNVDISSYLTDDLKPYILSCKSIGVEAVPSSKENKYHAYLLWEVEINEDRDIEDIILEDMICSFLLNTLWYLNDSFAEDPVRNSARRSSKYYKRRDDGLGYEADVADSIAYYFPIHKDKKNPDFNTRAFRKYEESSYF